MADAPGAEPVVEFEVLVRGPSAGAPPSVETVEGLRPRPADLERCRRYLADRGVTCHATDFGLACSAPRRLVEALLGSQLEPVESTTGPPWRFVGAPRAPDDIAELVEQVSLVARPELFD